MEMMGDDWEAIAHAFPGLESLDLPEWSLSLKNDCAAALPALRSLRIACSQDPPGMPAVAWLKRVAPALEVLHLTHEEYSVGDGAGCWQDHPSLRELELVNVLYYFSSTTRYDASDLRGNADCCGPSFDEDAACGAAVQSPPAHGCAPPRRGAVTYLGPPGVRLPALRSLCVSLTCDSTPHRADLAAGPAALRGWAAAWTHLRALHLGGGAWFDVGGALPVLAERLGPHLAHLSLDPCAFIAGASDFELLPDCLRTCMPRFVALEELDLKLCESAGVIMYNKNDASSREAQLALTPALLTGLAAPLAGALRPPRLRNARLRLPSFEAVDGGGSRRGRPAGPWAEALVRQLTRPGLCIELYACSEKWLMEEPGASGDQRQTCRLKFPFPFY
jgi:hypothetical protein